jgi:hypothetical protein
MLVVLFAAGSVLTTAPPSWAQEECEPGENCTGFEEGEYKVDETASYVELQVSAGVCCPTAQGQVDYQTLDLTAFAGRDYQQTSGTLTYAGGGGGSIKVPIIKDDLSEGEERFEVRLTSFRGTFTRRGRESSIVTIVDFSPETSVGRTGSNQPSEGSQEGSSTRAPLPARATSISPTDPGDQSAQVSPATTSSQGESPAEEGAERVAAEAERDGNGTSPVRHAGLRALLLVMVVAAGFLVKKNLDARKST